jgi:hypothetical protein
MLQDLVIDTMGWIGAIAILLAYALVSAKKVPGDSVLYQGLNLAGSALLIVNSFYYGAFPSVAVNVVWIGIAAFALIRARSGRRR